MTSNRQKFYVGVFMAAGTFLAIVALIWLGMNRYFEEGRLYATYFDQSVQGLNVDSPVKYRGVTVGRVQHIGVAPDSRLIMVVMLIDTDLKLEEDIIAQLKVVGITGAMFIELDRAGPGEMALSPELSFPSRYPIIASKPSEISKLFRGLDEVIQQFGSLDLPGLTERAKTTLDTINTAVADLETKKAAASLQTAMDNVNRLLGQEHLQHLFDETEKTMTALRETILEAKKDFAITGATVGDLRDVLAENRRDLRASITGLNQTITSVRRFFSQADRLTADAGWQLAQLNQQLTVSLESGNRVSSSLDSLLEDISTTPSLLLFSTPPAPRHLEDAR